MKKNYETPKLQMHGDVAKITNNRSRNFSNNFAKDYDGRRPPCGS